MLDIFAAFAVILGGAVAVGVFLDTYTSDEVRNKLWLNLNTADQLRWSSAAVNVVTISYEAIFSGRIGSWRFFKRSVLIYAILIISFLAFIGIFFPHVFVGAISPY